MSSITKNIVKNVDGENTPLSTGIAYRIHAKRWQSSLLSLVPDLIAEDTAFIQIAITDLNKSDEVCEWYFKPSGKKGYYTIHLKCEGDYILVVSDEHSGTGRFLTTGSENAKQYKKNGKNRDSALWSFAASEAEGYFSIVSKRFSSSSIAYSDIESVNGRYVHLPLIATHKYKSNGKCYEDILFSFETKSDIEKPKKKAIKSEDEEDEEEQSNEDDDDDDDEDDDDETYSSSNKPKNKMPEKQFKSPNHDHEFVFLNKDGNWTCDGASVFGKCKSGGIHGPERYKCKVCDDFDFCNLCLDEPKKPTPTMNLINQQGLEAHNRYRAKHNVGPLEYNAEIASYAQEWANHLASRNTMYHRQPNKYGENIAMGGGYDVSGGEASKMWYDEISAYNFRSGSFGMNTGHFTQLVWAGTKQVGFGKAVASNGYQYVVANYSPSR